MLICIVAIFIAVGIIFLHERVLYLGAQPPLWLRQLVCLRYASVYGLEKLPDIEVQLEKLRHAFSPLQMIVCMIQEIRDDIEASNAVSVIFLVNDKFQEESRRIAWQRIFSFIDIGCLVFLLVLNLLVTLVVFLPVLF